VASSPFYGYAGRMIPLLATEKYKLEVPRSIEETIAALKAHRPAVNALRLRVKVDSQSGVTTKVRIAMGNRLLTAVAHLQLQPTIGTRLQGKIGVRPQIALMLLIPFIVTYGLLVDFNGPSQNTLLAGVIFLSITLLFFGGMVYFAIGSAKDSLRQQIEDALQNGS